MGEPLDPAPGEGSARAVPAEDAYTIRAGAFEGPLDLLLHLVRVNEVDITDIPIAEITSQYHAYLDVMREMNLEIAGEYLVMAATLMHIKSRMLLPDDSPPGEEAREDPRAELAQQLLEYQRFKQAAENLQAMDSVRDLIWTRDGVVPEEFAGEEMVVADLFDLISAFRKLLGRMDEESRLRIRRDDVSVADKIGWLTDLLEDGRSLSLLELLRALEDPVHRIATFLAVLEMMRLRLILVLQRGHLGEIWLVKRPEPGGAAEGKGGGEEPGMEER